MRVRSAATLLPRFGRFLTAGAIVALGACVQGDGGQTNAPNSAVQQDIGQPLKVFAPTAMPDQSASRDVTVLPSPSPPLSGESAPRAGLGIAALAQTPASDGNPKTGRDFAFDNCRPCHVVAPNQGSAVRFANAPDFKAIANMATTTPFSLTVWLTNPHPTMPSLVLSPQEANDVIAYILSLRDRR